MNRTKKVLNGHGWDRAIVLPIAGVTALLGVALATGPQHLQAGSTWGGNGGNRVHVNGSTWGGNGGNRVHINGSTWGGNGGNRVHINGSTWGGNGG